MIATRHDDETAAAATLTAAGFTHEQARTLLALQARYNPFAEFVESNAEWARLQFLKWLYEHGRYARD
jgi:hypothetical protein